MKKMNKKGFTIVELVIVIAVIAILAAVMIPTFGGIIERANQSSAMQEATNLYKALLTEEEYNADLDLVEGNTPDLYIVVDEYTFSVVNGSLDLLESGLPANHGYKALTGDYAGVYVYQAPAQQP